MFSIARAARSFAAFVTLTLAASSASAQSITTVTGAGTIDSQDVWVVYAPLSNPRSTVVDAQGNAYVADTGTNRIKKILTNGVVHTIAGWGSNPSADGTDALYAALQEPVGLALDASGNLYFAERLKHIVWKINANGYLVKIAGDGYHAANGDGRFAGDGGAATSASLNYPSGLAFDSSGNLYIADRNNQRVRKIANGTISTFAGNGTAGFAGDGGAPTAAQLNLPEDLSASSSGILVSDTGNNRIRKVAGNSISTVAGGSGPFTLSQPKGAVVGADNATYVADSGNHRILRIASGTTTVYAGTGTAGFGGDAGPAASALLNFPMGLSSAPGGAIYFADVNNHRLRRIASSILGAPQNVVAYAGNAYAIVNLAPPLSDGGLPVAGYVVTSTPAGGQDNGQTTSLRHQVTGLANNVSYTFQAVAFNAAGLGVPAANSNAVVPASVPEPPSNPFATEIDGGKVNVTFGPSANNGITVDGYTVTSLPAGGVDSNAGSAALTHTMTGLTAGVTYTFSVVATGPYGTSPPSPPTNEVTPGLVWGPPAVTAQASGSGIYASWEVPTQHGGALLDGYRVTLNPGGTPIDVGYMYSYNFNDLAPGNYTVTVEAMSVSGPGQPGVSNQVTVLALPGPAQNLVATPGDGYITIAWDPPSDEGVNPITGWQVVLDQGGIIQTLPANYRSAYFDNLQNGTPYTVTIRALTDAGPGDPAQSSPVTPVGLPEPPQNVTAEVVGNDVVVSFSPASDGGSPITSYIVVPQGGNATDLDAGTDKLSHTLTDVTVGSYMYFYVYSVNAMGQSPTTNMSNFVYLSPSLSVDDVSVFEGNSGTKTVTATVTLSSPATRDIHFDIGTANGTATAGTDYVAQTLTGQTIYSGSTTRTVSFTVNGDTSVEPDETFLLQLANLDGAVAAGSGQGTVTIVNDDAGTGPALSVNDVSVTEGDSGTKSATFTVTLSAAQAGPVSFDIATSDGNATAGQQYIARSAHLVIPAGSTSASFDVGINGNTTPDQDRTFYVNLSNGVGATIVDPQGLGTITNDDPYPALSISDVSVEETDGGTKYAIFNLTLASPSTEWVVFSYATSDGTATGGPTSGAGVDYQFASGNAYGIPPGQTSATIGVPYYGDTVAEPDETFNVTLFNVTGATLVKAVGVGTIVNDDVGPVAPTLSIDDVSVSEGNSGTKTATFTVTLSQAAASLVTVNVATANGTATAGSDYVAKSQTGLRIPAGTTSKTFVVTINGDTAVEPDETFTVNLSSATNATIADGVGLGTITNDDSAGTPTLSVGDVSITEGNSGTKTATFTVSLSAAASSTVSFNVATANGTATAGSDYVALSLTGQTIAAGQTSKTVSVTINGDTAVEPDETFNVNVSNVTGATVADGSATGTISNDDGAATPTLSIGDVSIAEGNSGTKTATFTVSLSAAASSTVSFDVATANGTATAGSDYVALSLTGQTIAAGQTSKTVSVTINGDTTVEPNETFNVNVSNVTGATVLDGSAVGTITNDDTAGGPTLSIGDVTIAEGNSATKTATFTITLSAAQSSPVTVNVATANGTATAGSDYVAKTTTGLRIPAGSTSKTFLVTINGDTTAEPDETFTVNLSNASTGITIADSQAVGTITNDDAAATPMLSIADASISEGNSGTKVLNFTVSLSPAAANMVAYDIATSNGTATAGSDYVASTLIAQTIAPGTTSKTFAVTINGDTTTEANETFNVTLNNVNGAILGDSTAVGTITNDDGATGPTLSIADVSVAEGNSLSKQMTFTVKLSAAASTAVTYNIATTNGTAVAPTDYTAKSLTAQSIAAGATTKTFTVAIKGDRTVEPNETFLVNVTNVVGAAIADGQAVGTITNDDAAALSVARFDAKELVDDVDDGNRQPQIAPGEYATLLADSASQLCRRAPDAKVIAVEGIEHQRVLADLADAANAICTGKPAYTAVMADKDSRGFLIATPAKGEVGIEVLTAPEANANAKSTALEILGAGHATPVTLVLVAPQGKLPSERVAQARALALQLQQRTKAQPDEALVLLGANAGNGMLDLTARELGKSKTPLPVERVLVNGALLKLYGQPAIELAPQSGNDPPAQVLRLQQ